MAQFFGLIPLNAANFDSGAATDGQVLTADGSGGAAFEDAGGGGGGAAFLYDGANFTVGEYDGDNYWYPIDLELTLDGTPISGEDVWLQIFVSMDGVGYPVSANDKSFSDIETGEIILAPTNSAIEYGFWPSAYTPIFVLIDTSRGVNEGTYRINVILPNGGYVASNGITWPPPE